MTNKKCKEQRTQNGSLWNPVIYTQHTHSTYWGRLHTYDLDYLNSINVQTYSITNASRSHKLKKYIFFQDSRDWRKRPMYFSLHYFLTMYWVFLIYWIFIQYIEFLFSILCKKQFYFTFVTYRRSFRCFILDDEYFLYFSLPALQIVLAKQSLIDWFFLIFYQNI